jgi:CRISPR-associated protein Cmr5
MPELRSQRFTTQALGHIQSVQGQGWAQEYGRLWLRFSALVLQNGLMQTVAFLGSKASSENDAKPNQKATWRMLLHLGEVLRERNEQTIESWLAGKDVLEYMRLTQKALDAATWYARFSRSVLKAEITGRDD